MVTLSCIPNSVKASSAAFNCPLPPSMIINCGRAWFLVMTE